MSIFTRRSIIQDCSVLLNEIYERALIPLKIVNPSRRMRIIIKAGLLPIFAPYIFFYTLLNALFIFRLEHAQLFITSKCTLNCKDCSLLIPYHKNQKHEPLQQLLDDMNKLTSIIPVRRVLVLGGEPFLHPNLDIILDNLIASKKIKVIEIVTNGTVFPNEALLEKLRNKKIFIKISPYKVSLDRAERFRDILESRQIRFAFNYDFSWVRMDTFHYRERIPSEHKKTYMSCFSKRCITLFRGKLYPCSPSPRAVEVGFVQESIACALDVYDAGKFNRKIIRDWYYGSDFFPVCCYCNGMSANNLATEPGIQVARASTTTEKDVDTDTDNLRYHF